MNWGITMKTKDLVLIALFTALTIVGGFLNIPTPTVSFSLQFVFCAYAGVLLGAKRALLSQLLYIAIGLAGLPVFTKGGGISYIFQPSFGFILGFAVCAFVIGLLVERAQNPGMLRLLASVMAGLLMTYLVGVPYLYFMVNHLAAPGSEISFATAISLGFTPFILFDMLKVVLVAVTGVKILPVLRRFN
jgi:biotin transport system substrate-specific component